MADRRWVVDASALLATLHAEPGPRPSRRQSSGAPRGTSVCRSATARVSRSPDASTSRLSRRIEPGSSSTSASTSGRSA